MSDNLEELMAKQIAELKSKINELEVKNRTLKEDNILLVEGNDIFRDIIQENNARANL